MALAALSRKPDTGYGLGRLLRGDLSHIWSASLQQIYVELAKLAAGGLVSVEVDGGAKRGKSRKIYSLTTKGREALEAWLANAPTPPAVKDDLLVRLWALPLAPHDGLVHALTERRERCRSWLDELSCRLKQEDGRDIQPELGYRLTLDAATAALEAQIAWCDRSLDRIRGVGDTRESSPDRIPGRWGKRLAKPTPEN